MDIESIQGCTGYKDTVRYRQDTGKIQVGHPKNTRQGRAPKAPWALCFWGFCSLGLLLFGGRALLGLSAPVHDQIALADEARAVAGAAGGPCVYTYIYI